MVETSSDSCKQRRSGTIRNGSIAYTVVVMGRNRESRESEETKLNKMGLESGTK